MIGYIEGCSDNDRINYCPICAEQIITWHSDGTAECEKCNLRFGVVEVEE